MESDKKDPFEMGMSEMEKFLKRYEIVRLKDDFVQKIVLMVIAALGFISAIAWDQTLKLIFIEIFGSLDSVGEKLLYAIIITVIAVLLSIILTRAFLKKKK